MNKFNEAARSAYEQYLIGGDSIEDVLLKMIPGSKYHDYLKIIHALKQEKGKKGHLSDDVVNMIKNFKKKHKATLEATKVDYQSLFIEFDNLADDKKQQRKLLEKLSGPKYLRLGLKHKNAAVGTSEGEKSEGEEEHKRHTLIYSSDDHCKEFLKKIENETAPLSSIHPSLVNRINYKNLSDSYFEAFMKSYPHVADITHETFMTKCAEFLDAYIKKYKGDSVSHSMQNLCGGDSSNFYKRFTLQQLEKLAESFPRIKEDSDWHGSVFSKRFYYELSSENSFDFSENERLDQLIEMYKAAQEMPKSFQSLILLEILVYGRKLDTCYKEYFNEYLKNPSSSYCMNESYALVENVEQWNKHFIVMSSRSNVEFIDLDFHRNLLLYYLEAFHRSGTDISTYHSYFDRDTFKSMVNEIKFLNGEEINQDDLSFNFEDLGNKVMINILESNPKSYKVDDKIKILCDLKNTPTVYLKIYEFNAENYYRNRQAAFDAQINLDGLEPIFERVEEFKESPQKKFRHLFEIPEIQNKSGLFVIDIISNGYSSRAVVKKGSLSLVTRYAREGHVCYVCNEDNEICKDDTTAIWFSNKYFKAREDGKIVIPYGSNYASGQAVLLHKGVADISYFSQEYENYSFECYFNLHHESLLMGKNATLLITPNLKINGRKCDLNLINK